MRFRVLILFLALGVLATKAQNTFNFDGQLSGVLNWSPEADAWGFMNGRYLPELNYDWKLDTTHSLYFEASANIWGSAYFLDDSSTKDGDISAYRVFARFSGRDYEVRVGLQKIDFGSASILRPLQWFNQIDPRDPLAISNGVNALLGRYYFENNANIWLWGLIENTEPRGYDIIGSNPKKPEFGGRFQSPVPRGELAVSYNHRTADASNLDPNTIYTDVPENRVGLDGKWDVGIGLWFESAYIKKEQNLGEQFLGTLGMDYTFPLGSGLNVVVEHLYMDYNLKGIGLQTISNTSALSVSYPIGFFDNLNLFTTYSWEAGTPSFFVNYQHDYRLITAYIMAFYTPDTNLGLGNEESDFVGNFTGPGLRLMLVFKH